NICGRSTFHELDLSDSHTESDDDRKSDPSWDPGHSKEGVEANSTNHPSSNDGGRVENGTVKIFTAQRAASDYAHFSIGCLFKHICWKILELRNLQGLTNEGSIQIGVSNIFRDAINTGRLSGQRIREQLTNYNDNLDANVS